MVLLEDNNCLNLCRPSAMGTGWSFTNVLLKMEQLVSSASKTLREDPGHGCLELHGKVSCAILSKRACDLYAMFSRLISPIAHIRGSLAEILVSHSGLAFQHLVDRHLVICGQKRTSVLCGQAAVLTHHHVSCSSRQKRSDID